MRSLPYGNKISGEDIRIGDGLCGEAAVQWVDNTVDRPVKWNISLRSRDMDTLSAWLNPLWGESIGDLWISLTGASSAEPWYFLSCQFGEAIKNSWVAGDFRRHDTHVTSL